VCACALMKMRDLCVIKKNAHIVIVHCDSLRMMCCMSLHILQVFLFSLYDVCLFIYLFLFFYFSRTIELWKLTFVRSARLHLRHFLDFMSQQTSEMTSSLL
jgi:hypothetical protein